MANNKYTVQLVGKFDYKEVVSGLSEIKKQISSSHIGDDIAKDLQKSFDKIDLKLPKIEKLINKDNLSIKEIEELQKLIQSLQKDFDEINKISSNTNFTESFSKIDLSKLENLDKQIKEIQGKVKIAREELVKTFSDKTFSTNSEVVKNAITELFSVDSSEVQDKFNNIRNTFENQIIELENAIRNSTDKKFDSGSSIIQAFFGTNSQVKIVKGQTEDFKKQVNDIIITLKNVKPGSDEAQQALRNLIDLLNNSSFIKNPNNETPFNLPTPQDLDILDNLKTHLQSIEELLNSKKDIFSENDKQLSEVMASRILLIEERLKNLENTQKEVIKGTNNLKDKLNDYNKELDEGAEKAKQEKVQQDALNATFGSLASRIEHAVSAMAIFNKSMQIIRNAIKSVEDLDAAFTQIAIVSEQSGEQAWKLFDDFNKLAKQYSITTKDLTEGAKLFYQQGLNAADTMKMVEASTVSAALGEVTMTEAANTLTAAIQGYNESAEVAMAYTDKIAMVGAVSAADFNELSTAMEKTASSAYTAGIDFDHLLGYLGKMIEVTREAPANLGTAMKTIIARFEDMKKDPMAILEDGVSANKVEAALATIGIALRDSEGEFRALQDVMDELGIKWNSLTRNQQAYIATVAAGSRQQSRFLALMNNYDRTLDLITESQNSAGAAAKQYATYQDSIIAAQARLTASWEKFYSKIVDNDIIKFVINGLSSVLEALSKIPPSITAIGATIGALQLQNFINNKGGIVGILGNLLKGNNLEGEAAKTGQSIITGIVKGITSNIKIISDKSKEAGKGFYTTWYDIYIKDIFSKIGKQVKNFGEVVKQLPSKISSGFKILKSMLTPEVLGITVAIAGIALLINHINKMKQRANDAAKAVQEVNEKLITKKDELQDREKLINSYDELIRKTNRTAEEQKELNDIIDNIAEVYGNAITYVDEMGDMHLANRDALALENEEYKEQIRILKNEVFRKQMEFFQTPMSQWTEENVTEAGVSGDFWRKFSKANNNVANLDLENNDQFQEIESFMQDWYSFNNNLADWQEQAAFTLKDVFNIELDTKGIKNLPDLLERVKASYIQATSDIVSATDMVNEEIQKLTINNWIDNLDYKSSQSGIVAYFKQLLQNLSFEDFQKYGDNLQKEFEDLLLKITEPDDIITAKNLFKDLVEGIIPLSEFQEKMKELGVTITQSFIDGINEGFENKEESAHQHAVEAVQAIYGEANYDNKSTETLNAMAELNNYGVKNSAQASALSDSYIKFQEIYEEMSSQGLYSGFEEAAEKILNDTTLSDGLKEKGKEIITEMGEQLKEEVINKNFDELQTELQQFVADSSKVIEDIKSGKGTKLTDTELTSSDSGVFLDQETGEIMVSSLRQALELEDQRNLLIGKINISYQNNIEEINQLSAETEELENKTSKISNEDKKIIEDNKIRIKQLKNQNSLMSQQLIYLNNQNKDSAQTGWGISLKYAQEYESQLKTIKSIEESLSKKSFLNRDELNQLYNIMPQFAKQFTKISEGMYTVETSAIENMKKQIKSKYEYELAVQRQMARAEYDAAKAEYETLVAMTNDEVQVKKAENDTSIQLMDTEVNANRAADQEIIDKQGEAAQESGEIAATVANNLVTLIRQALDQIGKDIEDFMQDGVLNTSLLFDSIKNTINKKDFNDLIGKAFDANSFTNAVTDFLTGENLQKAIENAKARMQAALAKLRSLESINIEEIQNLEKAIADAGNNGSKNLDKLADEAKAVFDAVEKILDGLEDLNKLLKETQGNLRDISLDYNPFLELFEEWEHEWDKFYNIKQLMKQIELQGNLINNIIDSDWATIDQKVKARKSSIGNIIEAMSANDLYIQALRETLTEEEAAFMEKYGRYGGVDTDSLTLYEKTANLHEMNDTINEVMLGIYNLEKELNDLGNQTNLFENQMQAAEDLQSTYESIVDTIDNAIEDLENNENITADTSGLKTLREQFKTVIESGLLEGITDFNSDEFKERFAKFNIEIDENSKIKTIDDLKDLMSKLKEEAQNMEVQVELETNVHLKDLEDFVEDYEAMQDRINEFWETLYSQVSNQEELLQKLAEERNYYIDNAISIEKELYNAIVENYQKEIDKKKKQYDELKQLDNEYLQSVRESINKEREMRNDAEKKKSYQQNIQRAQLLQMDTSGTYRAELASLNKEIKNQRDELYDDLVDKQVEALEKEIEARHELYDKEVAAMEERLNYMQENSILIWEQVNNIISEGSTAMMAILENTTTFMNSNELERQKIRENWELSTKNAYEAVNGTVIDTLEAFIVSARENIINKTPEVANAIDAAEETYRETERIAKEMGFNARNIAGSLTVYNEAVDVYRASIDAFRTEWIAETNQFTTHMETWGTSIEDLEKETRENIARIRAHNLAYNGILDSTAGSIKAFNEGVVQSVSTLYDIFISDRENYKIGLTNVINSISTEIAQAITAAANAIKTAAESVQFTPQSSPQPSNPQPSNPQPTGPQPSNPQPTGPQPTVLHERWKAEIIEADNYYAYMQGKWYTSSVGDYNSEADAISAADAEIKRLQKLNPTKYYKRGKTKSYKKGGLANFTGPAWLDGSPLNPERVLSPRQTKLFESMVSSLEKTANNSTINSGFNSSYNIGEIKTVIQVDRLDNQTDINKLAKQVEDKIVKDIRNRVSISINKGV